MIKKDYLREELVKLLRNSGAHVNFDAAVSGISKEYYGASIKGLPYTLWRILQHMRISQRDIIDYIIDPDYTEKVWPEDYWPKQKVPPSTKVWNECIDQIKADLEEVISFVEDPQSDLLSPIPYVKNGPPLLREILLVADHNSYHIGQLILIRGWLGIWKD